MSDGISEGYRASRAADSFEKMWDNAQVENLLLDLKAKITHLTTEQLLETLTVGTCKLEIQAYNRFQVMYDGKIFLTESVEIGKACGVVKRYAVAGSFGGVHKKFESDSLIESLRDAFMFASWMASEEGQRAKEVYNDW